MERLARRPYITMSPDAISPVGYMSVQAGRGAVPDHRMRRWMPLLVDALLGDDARGVSRLARLQAIVKARPGHAWTVDSNRCQRKPAAHAVPAGIRTDAAGLALPVRIARARHLLAQTAVPIAELAGLCGYADQSALTWAMRRDAHAPSARLPWRSRWSSRAWPVATPRTATDPGRSRSAASELITTPDSPLRWH